MLNYIVGGDPGLALQVLRQLQLPHRPQKKRTMSVRGVSWLDEPKAARSGARSADGLWTCPRCRSHRCIRTNPGDTRQAVYCCAVCGYTFSAAASARLLKDG